MNGILFVSSQTVNDHFTYICKDYAVAGLSQQHADESAADIACTELNSGFHNGNNTSFFQNNWEKGGRTDDIMPSGRKSMVQNV